jgi:3-oxoadipate enol-lactonase
MSTSVQSFTTRDKTRITFAVNGDPKAAKRAILIHSLAMDHAYWTPVAKLLVDQGFCAVALDCRGHGASDKPGGPYTVSIFANDVADLLDHLGWDKAIVAGSSMGGSVALALAIEHPEKVSGLALIDTTSWYGEDAPKAWEQRAKAAAEKGLASLIDFQLTRWFGEDFKERKQDVVKACVDTFLKNDVKAYVETCRMLGACDLRAKLGTIGIPTRVFVGEEDYATPPAMAEVLHNGIPGATLKRMPKARHLTPLEVPSAVAAEITALA